MLWRGDSKLLAAVALLLVGVASSQAGVALNQVPLFLSSGAAPNLIVTVDDSGSMERGYLPESLGESEARRNSALFTATSYNPMYYNPRTLYLIPNRGDGVVYTTSFTSAYVNGFDRTRGVVNLAAPPYRPIFRCSPGEALGTCSTTDGSGTITAGAPVNYAYGNCTAHFRDNGSGADQIVVTGCNMPYAGDAAPANADKGIVVVSNAGGLSKTYSTTGSSPTIVGAGLGTLITLSGNGQLGAADTSSMPGVTFRWTRTPQLVSAGVAAYYHMFFSDARVSRPGGCRLDEATAYGREDPTCYVRIMVGSTEDVATGSASDKKMNFAIWYSFYRTRALAAMSAGVNAVSSLGTNQVRLAWQTLNNGGCTVFGTSCRGYDQVPHENRIRSLDALRVGSNALTHRSDFFDWITRLQVGGMTPLRDAMRRAGEYYSVAGRDGPYAQEPYVGLGTELACRRNFHVMMTDGMWNSDLDADYGGDLDSTPTVLPDGKMYTPRFPYKNAGTPPAGQSYRNTLADLAFKYWATDLRSSTRGSPALPNALAPFITDRSGTPEQQYWNARNDVATWQHMVNYTIGLGLGGLLTDPAWGGSTFTGDFPALTTGAKTWPPVNEYAIFNGEPIGHVYDLWHAAVNSRGQFFSAEDPAGINNAFRIALSTIVAANPSAASVAANSSSLQTDSMIYQARFDSADWHGQLVAYRVAQNGGTGSAVWDAAERVPAPGARRITTWSGTRGADFKSCASDLTPAQQLALNQDPNNIFDNRCQDRVDWLRGNAAKEQRNGGSFRDRPTSVLGDIVNSAPIFVGKEDQGYASGNFPEAAQYASFMAAKASRIPMVYVGANDGMLHGFRADVGSPDSGKELMAHVPAALVPKLNRLVDPGYNHLYFVDGAPNVGDAFLNGGWRTVLVSGLGAGGRSVFALDVSDPGNHGAAKVLWEFTDADLGFTFSQPQIGRLSSGRWVAVFGNGYNSPNDTAFLYVVDLASGTLLRKIAAGRQTSNGLSTPALVDTDSDRIVDAVYAGDLQGNLWKFDLDAGTGSLLFVARGPANLVQPITAKPSWTVPTTRPQGGVMVFFGTGQYLNGSDLANSSVQTFYGIWDNNAPGTVVRAQLQAQAITAETRQFGFDVRETSANNVDYTTQRGWYMDLRSDTSAPGERVDSTALYRYGRIIFVTTTPSTDACLPGGSSWLMELDAFNGARTAQSVFDFNNDGAFNASDLLASGDAASGVRSPVGIIRTPAWMDGDRSSQIAYKIMGASNGSIFSLRNRKPAVAAAVRRIMWQQLQ